MDIHGPIVACGRTPQKSLERLREKCQRRGIDPAQVGTIVFDARWVTRGWTPSGQRRGIVLHASVFVPPGVTWTRNASVVRRPGLEVQEDGAAEPFPLAKAPKPPEA